VSALRDPRVTETLAKKLIESKLQPLIDTITELKSENERKAATILKLTTRVEELETYTRRDNLLITGLPVDSYAEAAAVPTETTRITDSNSEPSECVERSVLNLFNHHLHLQIQPNDISITHRLKKRNASDAGPPVTMVRFTNRKTREAVYKARRQLRGAPNRIFINEDLTKSTADLFRQARQLVSSSWKDDP